MTDITMGTPVTKRKGVWLAASVLVLLGIAGAGALVDGGSTPTHPAAKSDVAASAAAVAWQDETPRQQRAVCSLYTTDHALALNAIDSGVGGGDPALLAAFDDLLSQEC